MDKARLLKNLDQMLLIRQFETRAENAYLHGSIGGFFHSYIGQEAIQVAAVEVFGLQHWYLTTYRCHALAYLLGASPKEMMAELFGRATGTAKGRGGSMHMYAERLLGGFAIVGGHIPVATGASFAMKYLGRDEELAICFLGDGAVAQGAFHEALNLSSLWDLPCLFIIENNQWGMGTAIERAVAVPRLAEDIAPGYNMKGYTLDGMDYFKCFKGFQDIYSEIKEKRRPILVEAITERFRGHSISDPGLYRTKEELNEKKKRDPLVLMKQELVGMGILTEEEYKARDTLAKQIVLEALEFAEKSPWPDPITLEEDVFAK
jgi:pyruvate dehydrogenase E1 component alpha subunit